MQEIIPLIKDLAIMLGIASVVVLVFQKIRQPVILGYILAGMIIGPYTPPYSFVSDIKQIHTFAELGVVFLMFAIGLDFSFHKLIRIGFSATITGVFKVVVIMAVGFFVGRLLHWNFYNSLFFAAALAISSTTIIVKAIEELNLKGKRFTDVVFGVLIVEDLLAILILTTLATIVATKHFLSVDMIFSSLKLFGVIGSWFISGYFLVPMLFRRIVKYVSEETLTIVSIALCLGMAVTAAYFHYSMALGAFIMGSIMAETPMVSKIKQLVSPLRDVFAAIFFISVGMLIDVRVFTERWQIILVLSIATIVGKVLVTTVGTFLTGQSVKTSIRSGFSMAPVGEFSFIIMGLGLSLGVIKQEPYQIIIGIAAITILVTPYLMLLSVEITDKLKNVLSARTKYFLDIYSDWVYLALASYKKRTEYRKFIFRIIVNGAIVAAIFTLVHNFVYPQILSLTHYTNVAKISSWLVALLFAALPIWGMLFSFRVISKGNQIPALFLAAILVVTEIIILSFVYFSTWHILLIIILIVAVLLAISYKQLEKSYHWFEIHFVRMLKNKGNIPAKYDDLSPWDTHLVEIVVTNDEPGLIVGKTLAENRLRQKFGINIVAIRRGQKILPAPRGEEKIALYDELIIVGGDDQIEAFKKIAEKPLVYEKIGDDLKGFILSTIIIDSDSPYLGKSIRDSRIREQVSGLVVGLERRGFRKLNPDAATILKLGDLLLVVGQTGAVCNLKQ